jgi:hypothetical protein
MVKCPAAREALRNVYSLHSTIDDDVDLSTLDFESDRYDSSNEKYQLLLDSKVSLHRIRRSSFLNQINVAYNLGWLFFADKPLVAKITPPYYPNVTPTPGALMAVGQYDIGQWYRPVNLDYHLPYNSTRFTVKSEQPLAFIEFKTESPIILHRYQLTPLLDEMAEEFTSSAANFGAKISLQNRYKMAKKADMARLVLSEIKKNLVS